MPRIHVVATGGTIAGAQAVPGGHGYAAGAFTVDALLAAVPDLAGIAHVSAEQLVNIGSQDMNDRVWLTLARRLEQLAASDDVDGIVVTHGTDTMEETAWFAHLTVRTTKPLVFVGSMRPATALGADGPANLRDAVALAADPAASGRGVLVVLNDTIHGARDAYKLHASRVDAFRSPERGPLGRFEGGRPCFTLPPLAAGQGSFPLGDAQALPLVFILYAHASMGRELIDAALAAGAAGLVIAGVGNGNMTDPALDALQEAAARGVAVVRSTRLPEGAVLRNGEVDDDARGFIAAREFKPGKARVLLQLALLSSRDPKALQEVFDQA
ncbi:type II asparaginase [Geminicoccus roseus]|uniref:type II asparaginase n=1 Tax=Geminicoccus roseus TaxID=404900 RepID=UPI00048235B8|nr:type II asparaginase [Geminicoccus roseus]